MKQLLFMVAMTLLGSVGPFFIGPFTGVAVYYLFAVLRPQYLWKWVLPDFGWSSYVAWATVGVTLWSLVSGNAPENGEGARPKWTFAHWAYLVFGCWVAVTYVTAQNRDVAWPWFVEYMKLFVMFVIASFAVTSVKNAWRLYLIATISLIYIAYEMNFLYFTAGRMDIFHNGYGGLDNNGAGLMLAMGIPLAINAWEASPRIWRWGFIAGVPLLIHAVLMSYSRGAMLSLILVTPLLIMRTRKRLQFTGVFLLLVALVPLLAGQEIRARFFTVQDYQTDESANERFASWNAAILIANQYPIFGSGIRNSNTLSFKFGADMEGRTIHSQYLQTLADSGYVGLALYLLALGSAEFIIIRSRRRLKKLVDDEEAQVAVRLMNGCEGALAVFCVGAFFLSLEVFELPYVAAFVGIQIAALTRTKQSATVSEKPAPIQLPVPGANLGPLPQY